MNARLFVVNTMYVAVGIKLIIGFFNISNNNPGTACLNALVALVCYFSYSDNRRIYDRMVQEQEQDGNGK